MVADVPEQIGLTGSIIGATLVGVDKANQNGMNYVEMTKNFFNKDNGWNVIMNFTSKKAHIGGGYGNDYWYDIYNNVFIIMEFERGSFPSKISHKLSWKGEFSL